MSNFNVIFRILNVNVIKFTPFWRKMAEDKVLERERLYDRFKHVESQMQCLKSEFDDLKSAFRKFTSDRSDGEDGAPVSKKRKICDFPIQNGYVIAYTDGACENNGSPKAKAGIGVWFGPNHPLNVSEPVKGKATNNVAEIQACIAAVKIAKENDIKKLKIITDSQFTINSMTKWIAGWKRKGWKLADGKSDVKNKTDFQELDNLCKTLDVQWQHVAGHAGIEGNEGADALARDGARRYQAA